MHRHRSRRSTIRAVLAACLMVVVLSGCLYPQENLAQNKASTKEAVRNMQAVIEDYQQETGLLPIVNSTQDTPKYEKYVVDLAKLQRMQYISQLPQVSFQMGGRYYFLILEEETNPTVKLMDIVVHQQINDLQASVNEYKLRHNSLPAGEMAYPGFSRIDYVRLGQKEPIITSLYSGLSVTAMLDEAGRVYIDYGIDIQRTVQRADTVPQPEQDLRQLLVNSSDYVPVKSPPYYWIEGEPQAVVDAIE